jgi:hypothetical protein
MRSAVLVAVGSFGLVLRLCGDTGSCHPGPTPAAAPEGHAHGVDERGDRVMGFDHEKTTHHFVLTREGGRIEVEAKSAGDGESRDRIRMHLGHIAKMFSEGNFEAPMLIHERVPPGVPVMKRLRAEIRYRFEPTEHGGRIVISTANAEALPAVHEFLRFQIRDHRTGDSGRVP